MGLPNNVVPFSLIFWTQTGIASGTMGGAAAATKGRHYAGMTLIGLGLALMDAGSRAAYASRNSGWPAQLRARRRLVRVLPNP